MCCRCFGYVNYYTEEEAERAASVKQGSKISGVAIKTKGPKVLSRQGHFNTSLPRPDGLNFRPLTDCSFFIMGKKCKKAGTVSIGHTNTCTCTYLRQGLIQDYQLVTLQEEDIIWVFFLYNISALCKVLHHVSHLHVHVHM